ncbi:MAG: hypothetical protein IPG71_04190 [bacterium]|nr:hypothetical protein [bacterium]
MPTNTAIFSADSKQAVLETLFRLAREEKSVPAIKLYLELAEQAQDNGADLSFEQAVELLKQHDTERITVD